MPSQSAINTKQRFQAGREGHFVSTTESVHLSKPMKAVYKELLDKSLGASLSAIEVYNKPDFKYREECFVILLVNAWELLLKAKILKDSGNKLSSLYVRQAHRYKRTRTGNYLTIELLGAIQKVGLDPTVIENLTSLVEVRDTAVHFYNDDGVRYVVYTLGVAALRNYQTLVKQWFGRSLTAYHFFILPLGFAHCFKTFRSIDLEASPAAVANLIRSVAETQEQTKGGGEFFFACEIATELKSAKKFASGTADLTVRIDQAATDSLVVIKEVKRTLDQYPLSYRELMEKIKKELPQAKEGLIQSVMKKQKVRGNEAYSAFSFRTKAHEDSYLRSGKLPTGTACIYNEDAVRFLIQKVQEELPASPGTL